MAMQMAWQTSLLHKRKKGPPLGLRNLGNSCYLNSVLQCLTYTPPFANFCLKNQHSSLCDSLSEVERKRDCPFCLIEKRIVRSLSVDILLDAPHKIQSCLRTFADHFRIGRQEDAHEFLRFVIDACHNTCLRLKKLQLQQRRKGAVPYNESGDTIVKEIFGGSLQSQVKCLSCGTESNKIDEIMDISLDLSQGNSLKEVMHRFFQPEVLDGNNKYKCEKCKKLVAARKQMSISRAPNILVIQLKRFEGIHGGKIDRAIVFDEVLVLSSYMCKSSQDPHPEYNLFGSIVHSGFSPESGHYYAYIKDSLGKWYCCNDSHVSLSTLEEVLSEKVYILFFSRTNQRPKPTKPSSDSNGLKSHVGNAVRADAKAASPLKTVPTEPFTMHSSERDASSTPKNGKNPSIPHIKFGKLSDLKRVQANGNGNGNIDVHKIGPMEKPSYLKESIGTEKNRKVVPSLANGNAQTENGSDAADRKSKQILQLSNGNGNIHNNGCNIVRKDKCEENGRGKIVAASTGLNSKHAVHSKGGDCPYDIQHPKRKLLETETCILFAEDDASRTKLEKFKKVLAMDASSNLQSCGWSDEVYKFMHARKRLCLREGSNIPTLNTEMKKMLIVEAKATFISQIPETLKEHLIERLRLLSQEKQFLDA